MLLYVTKPLTVASMVEEENGLLVSLLVHAQKPVPKHVVAMSLYLKGQ